MNFRDAYENAYRSHRLEWNGLISEEEYVSIRGVYVRHKLLLYWRRAMKSLYDRKLAESYHDNS